MGTSFIDQIIRWDNQLTNNIRIDRSLTLPWRTAAFIAHSGDSWWCLTVLFTIWLFSKGELRYITAAMGLGTFILAILVLTIKFFFRRKRPEGDWGAIYRATDPHSFPSGHAARVSFLAAMAWEMAPPWVAVIITIWAVFVSFSRIQTGLHYFSDVLAGVLLGILFALGMKAFTPYLVQLFPWAF